MLRSQKCPHLNDLLQHATCKEIDEESTEEDVATERSHSRRRHITSARGEGERCHPVLSQTALLFRVLLFLSHSSTSQFKRHGSWVSDRTFQPAVVLGEFLGVSAASSPSKYPTWSGPLPPPLPVCVRPYQAMAASSAQQALHYVPRVPLEADKSCGRGYTSTNRHRTVLPDRTALFLPSSHPPRRKAVPNPRPARQSNKPRSTRSRGIVEADRALGRS
jgi:hypothetical protein